MYVLGRRRRGMNNRRTVSRKSDAILFSLLDRELVTRTVIKPVLTGGLIIHERVKRRWRNELSAASTYGPGVNEAEVKRIQPAC